ncbi:MAG: hypothetical protein KGJ06_05060, partial [Pseudomonadota bacterium]|nr:hypothetical protein [Pseudomonadota bacterium]
PDFKRLESLVPVEIELIDAMDRSHGHTAMSACNRLAIEKSDNHGRIIVFLQPDTLVSDGTLKNMERVLKEGKRVVQVAGFRTQLERMIPSIRTHYDAATSSIQLSGRQLVDIAKDKLHPISQTCLWDSPRFTNYNAHIYWRVGDEGFFARCAHFHPLAVYPRVRHARFDFTVDYNYFDQAVPNFDDYYIATDSDEMFMCEMSRESYFIGSDAPNTASAFQIARWMEGHTTEKHRRSFSKKIYFHNGSKENAEWRKAEAFSDQVLKEAFSIVNKNLVQLWKTPFYFPILAERTRLYYHTHQAFHKSDRAVILWTSKLVPAYKAYKQTIGQTKVVLYQYKPIRTIWNYYKILRYWITTPRQTLHKITARPRNYAKILLYWAKNPMQTARKIIHRLKAFV